MCGGGSSSTLVDIWTTTTEYECRHQGEKNWMTPGCKECKGLKREEKELSIYEQDFNKGVEALYKALTKKESKIANKDW